MSSIGFADTTAGDLAFRMLLAPEGQWWALETNGKPDEDVAESLTIALEAQEAASVHVIAGLPSDPSLLGIVIATRLGDMGSDEWAALALSRVRWLAGPTVVLLVTTEAWRALTVHAPDVASWLRGKVFRWCPELDEFTEQDIRDRLSGFREEFGYTDAEIIALAEARRLPADPVFAEWVSMLGRGDLLG